MLHGAGDAERQVQLGVDGHAGRADLALVAAPSRRPWPRGWRRARAQAVATRASTANGSGPPRPAPPATMRAASARSTVAGSGGRSSTTHGPRRRRGAGAGLERPGRRGGAAGGGVDARPPGTSVATTGTVEVDVVLEAVPAWSVTARSVVPTGARPRAGGRARRQPRGQVTAVGRAGQQHRLVGHQGRQRGRPATGARTRRPPSATHVGATPASARGRVRDPEPASRPARPPRPPPRRRPSGQRRPGPARRRSAHASGGPRSQRAPRCARPRSPRRGPGGAPRSRRPGAPRCRRPANSVQPVDRGRRHGQHHPVDVPRLGAARGVVLHNRTSAAVEPMTSFGLSGRCPWPRPGSTSAPCRG